MRFRQHEQVPDFAIQSGMIHKDVHHKVRTIRLGQLLVIVVPSNARVTRHVASGMNVMVNKLIASHERCHPIHNGGFRGQET